jgi:hypothetical protein
MKPEILEIFGLLIPIEYVDDLIETDEAEGDFCKKNLVVRIDSSLEGVRLKTALLHEIGHALFYRMGWCQGIDSKFEEAIVDSYATMLVELGLVGEL